MLLFCIKLPLSWGLLQQYFRELEIPCIQNAERIALNIFGSIALSVPNIKDTAHFEMLDSLLVQ